MSWQEPLPPEQEAIFRVVRTLRPPPGARERILAGAVGRERLHDRRRTLGLAAVAVAAGLAVWAAWSARTPAAEPARAAPTGPRAAADEPAAGGAGSDRAPAEARVSDERDVRVVAGRDVQLALDRARVTVRGPARVAAGGDRVRLREGRVEVRGSAELEGPGGSARVTDGEFEAAVVDSRLVVTVFAGSAEVTAGTCELKRVTRELAPPSAPEGEWSDSAAAAPNPGADRASARGRRDAELPVEDSELAAVVGEFERALALAEQPRPQLAALRALRHRHPRSDLAHEIDLAIIGALIRLGEREQAARELRVFERRYPDSPKLMEVRASLAAGSRPR